MSSFIKKNPRLSGIIKSDETQKSVSTGIPGTSPSLTGASSLLTSTGVADLDVCLGGGLPVGSLLTAFEDFPASKANYTWTAIVRCFLAECYATASLDWSRKDSGWVALVGHDISGILSTLPKPEITSSKEPLSNTPSNDDSAMKIAWRYEGLKEFDSNLKRPISALSSSNEKILGHTFDLGRKHESIPKQLLETPERALQLDLNSSSDLCDYQRTWSFLKESIEVNQRSGLGRIVIGSLAAPGLWKCPCPTTTPCGPAWLIRKISHLIQETSCLVLVTIPTAYLVDKLVIPGLSSSSNSTLLPSWVSAVENVSDVVIELKPLDALTPKSSASKSKNLLTREYDGFFIIRKYLRRHNSFRPFIPETANLAFKFKRRRFRIEKFHLPPSIDTEQSQPAGSLCSSSKQPADPTKNTNHPLDF